MSLLVDFFPGGPTQTTVNVGQVYMVMVYVMIEQQGGDLFHFLFFVRTRNVFVGWLVAGEQTTTGKRFLWVWSFPGPARGRTRQAGMFRLHYLFPREVWPKYVKTPNSSTCTGGGTKVEHIASVTVHVWEHPRNMHILCHTCVSLPFPGTECSTTKPAKEKATLQRPTTGYCHTTTNIIRQPWTIFIIYMRRFWKWTGRPNKAKVWHPVSNRIQKYVMHVGVFALFTVCVRYIELTTDKPKNK